MGINALLTALADELAAGGVEDVLDQRFTFALLWDDLARLAGEDPPAWVAARVAARLDERIDLAPPVARRLPERLEPAHFFDAETAPALAARGGRG